jgi:hypothetical protein
MDKIPAWWLKSVEDKPLLYKAWHIFKLWFWSYGNPIWSIRDTISRRLRR